MQFEDLVRSIDSFTSRNVVGVAIYYQDQINGEEYVESDEISDVIKESRLNNISGRSIGAHIRYLKEDNLISTHKQGYRLTPKGIDHFKSLIGEHETNIRDSNLLSHPDLDDKFYSSLIEDINECYRKGVDDAAIVLTRKLLENLVIDILRARYGLSDDRRNLFYNTDRREFHRFSVLIENLEENISDFEYFSERMDEWIIQLLDDLREQGNAGAHSIEVSPTESEIEEFSEKAEKATEVLFFTLRKIRNSR